MKAHRIKITGTPWFVLLACIASASLQAQQSKPSSAALLQGRQVFSSSCAGCHGLDGRGGERAPDIASKREVQRLSNAALARIVHDGLPGTGMPSFHLLGASRIQAVVLYVRSLQGRGQPQRLPGNPVAGKGVFFGKAGCGGCHMVAGEGGFIGSDLSNYAAAQSANEIRDAILHPEAKADPAKKAVVVTTASGEQLTGLARNEDNFSLQLQTLDGAFHLFAKSDLKSVEHQDQSLMPSDYGSRMSRAELDDVVSYLMSVAQSDLAGTKHGRKAKKPQGEDEE
ncbi:MAG TPA: c-type cytochrome [Terriglobales bacterium]|nr:c-type cytochrome [Terriglobales bacterium]